MIHPDLKIGAMSFFCADNMEVMKQYPDKYFDLVCVDIPYGLGDKLTQGGTWASKYKKGDADLDVLPSKDYFKELFRISKNQIDREYFDKSMERLNNYMSQGVINFE